MTEKNPMHPMQPIVLVDGIARFKSNPIVRFLLAAGPFDMNQIACLEGVTEDDHQQFAQLIGYSVDGYADLSYSNRRVVGKADRRTTKL